MHITLTGNLGSGKSTICRYLEGKYGYEIYSTGKVQRKLAEDLGITVLEMNQRMCNDPSFDHMIDDTVTRISEENPDKKIIFDSRLAWHFTKTSFKVFLSVNIDEAARRVFSDNRGSVETYKSLEDTKQQLIARAQTEDKRYKDIYSLDYFNFSNYNLVLDSTFCPPEFLAERIIAEHELYCKKEGFYATNSCKVLMSPCRLHTAEDVLLSTPVAVTTDSVPYAKELVLPCCQDGADFLVLPEATVTDKASVTEYPLVQITI